MSEKQSSPSIPTDELILHHYCPTEAFFEIIRKKRLRAGQLSAMNDSAEFTWLLELAKKGLKKRYDELAASEGEAVKMIALDSAIEALNEPITTDPYCVCFSAEGDVLSQWRAYAGNATGFSIGFKHSLVKKEYLDPKGKVFLNNVYYELSEHNEIVTMMVDTLQEWAIDIPSGVRAATNSRQIFLHAAPTCKNPAFKEEKELRLVYHQETEHLPNSDNNEFAVKNGRIVHYKYATFQEIFNTDDAIEVIYLGPRSPMTENDPSLKYFLKTHGFENVRIVRSSATLV